MTVLFYSEARVSYKIYDANTYLKLSDGSIWIVLYRHWNGVSEPDIANAVVGDIVQDGSTFIVKVGNEVTYSDLIPVT